MNYEHKMHIITLYLIISLTIGIIATIKLDEFIYNFFKLCFSTTESSGNGGCGEASTLLRTLISCRKIGVPNGGSIQPQQAHHSGGGIVSVSGNQSSHQVCGTDRRKQSFPTRTAATSEDWGSVQYLPDFTGNNPWCNLSSVKSGRVSMISFISIEQH